MKRALIIILLLNSLTYIAAQQDPVFSHIFFDKVKINPAFAGNQGDICVGIINRQQWVGFEGAPQTTALNANMPVRLFGVNSGVGLSLMDDRLGFENNFQLGLQYAYFAKIGNNKLGIGADAGFYNIAFDGTWTPPDAPAGSDPAIPAEKDNSFVFDLAFGLTYFAGDFYIGLSATHLTEPKLSLSNSAQSFLKRHYYLMAGYNWQLMDGSLDLSPNLLIKSDAASAQITINLTATYNKKFWGGVTYRTIDAIDIMAGIELFNGMRLGYAYGLNFSKLISTNGGSHEVMLGYCFSLGFDRTPQKYKSVRFL